MTSRILSIKNNCDLAVSEAIKELKLDRKSVV